MAKFKPNICISDCWSSIGNITFYHKNGICYFRSKPYSEFAGTREQLENLNLHRRAIRAWQSLPHRKQLKWRELAKNVIAHRPPYDNTSHISGYNLFVSAYHGFAQLGNEQIPKPRQFEQFPVFSMDYVGCKQMMNKELHLDFRLTLCGASEPQRYRILTKIQTGEPGCGRNPGLMRNHLSPSVPMSESSELSIIVPDTNPPLHIKQLHCHYLLLDTETGYRSQYHSLSTIVNVVND